MLTTRSYRAVIFDMDGVLLDTERLARAGWQTAARARGYEISDELFLQTVGRTLADTYRILRTHLGEEFPAEQVRAERLRYADTVMAAHGVPVKDGARELLQVLKQLPIPLSLATSTHRDLAMARIAPPGLLDFFDALVTGDQITHGKPAPDIFLAAAAALQRRPEECVVVEDSHPGVEAALAAGMAVIVVPDLQPPSQKARSQALTIAPSLTALIEYLPPLLETSLPA